MVVKLTPSRAATAEKLAETGQLEQAVLVANCGLDQEMVCTDLRALPEGAGYYTTILVKE